MTFVVNGMPIRPNNRYLLNWLDLRTLQSVEIYRGPSEIPPDLRHFGYTDLTSDKLGIFGQKNYKRYIFRESGIVV
jgi:hypothetical protein